MAFLVPMDNQDCKVLVDLWVRLEKWVTKGHEDLLVSAVFQENLDHLVQSEKLVFLDLRGVGAHKVIRDL